MTSSCLHSWRPTCIYQILADRRPPPVKHLGAMTRVLELGHAECHSFLALAALSHVPAALRDLVEVSHKQISAGTSHALIDDARAIASKAKPKRSPTRLR
jgi:hypothetical protein